MIDDDTESLVKVQVGDRFYSPIDLSSYILKELKKDYFELSEAEKSDLQIAISNGKSTIENSFNPDGYNIGMNCGEVAGQTVMHFHCHIIPRYTGDMANPRGGIRHCVEGKGYY